MSSTATTNGTLTATAQYLAAGASAGAETNIDSSKITISNNVVTIDVSDYTTVGGTVTLSLGITEDNTVTATKTGTVLGISLSDLTALGDTLSGTVTTNDSDYDVEVLYDEDGLGLSAYDYTDITSTDLTKSGNAISVDLTGKASGGVIKITVSCASNENVTSEKTYTVV